MALAWQSLGQNVRRTFGQAGSEAQPEARARGPARILAEVEPPRVDVELTACPLQVLRRDFVAPSLAQLGSRAHL